MRKRLDFSEILRPHENMWVALSKDDGKVIAAEKTLTKLFEKLAEKDHRKFEFLKVPEFDMCYAPTFL